MGWSSAKDVDWSALYADQLPRVYNYFRFRLELHKRKPSMIPIWQSSGDSPRN
jgi:hypothetical protein